MKIIVTGASGYLGTSLIADLRIGSTIGTAVSRRRLEHLRPGWTWRSRDEMFREKRRNDYDVLIHLEVKQHTQDPSPSDVGEFQTVNVEGTQKWLDWASFHQVKRFVFFSSIKASGESSVVQDESSQSKPNTPYGESKLRAERLVSNWAAASPGRAALILRPAVVYGPGNAANILSLMEAISKDRFFLVGKSDNVKSMISLRNLTGAVNHLLNLPAAGAQIFYLTDEKSYSVAQIAEMTAELLNKNRSFRSLPISLARSIAIVGTAFVKLTGRSFPLTTSRLDAFLESTHFSSAKLQSTGFVHPQSTREGLEEMVGWFLQSRGIRKHELR